MKSVVLFSLFYLLICDSAISQDWTLAWSDEFDVAGQPDQSKWSFEVGKIRNRESQYYTDGRTENVRVEDGMLVIEARTEKYEEAKHTSASVITRGKKDFLYGRIEVRAKLPTGVGTWPAIWMLGSNNKEVGWPMCGEIDIMENVGYDPDTIHANVHTKAYNHAIGTNKGNSILVRQPYKEFHVYAVEWFEDHMDFFVDDHKYFSFANEHKTKEEWPFDAPHYLILNIAVGGSWGGQYGIDESIFPQQMLVDYVRYYEMK